MGEAVLPLKILGILWYGENPGYVGFLYNLIQIDAVLSNA